MGDVLAQMRDGVVSVTFVDRVLQTLVQRDIVVPTGGSSGNTRLATACCDTAIDYGYTHWVQPYREAADKSEEWLVFARSRQVRQFLKRFPSRDAAEMWVLHHEP